MDTAFKGGVHFTCNMLFKSLKLYLNQDIPLETLSKTLVDFGYRRQEMVSAEGDFSLRGAIIDIFPVSFELPIRIELDNEKIISIKTFNFSTGEALWRHNIVIILAHKKPSGVKTAAGFSTLSYTFRGSDFPVRL